MSCEIKLNHFYREIMAIMTRDCRELINIENSLAEIADATEGQTNPLENVELTNDLILAHIKGLCTQTSLDIQAEVNEENKMFRLQLAVATLRVIFTILDNWEFELFEDQKDLSFPMVYGDEYFNFELHSKLIDSIFRSSVLGQNNYFLFKTNHV